MELEINESGIIIQKELNKLDNLLFEFIKSLDKAQIKYIVVSGYVAILFGRSRASPVAEGKD